MNKSFYLIIPILFFSCNRSTTDDTTISKKYYHKYGFEVPKQEWENRKEDGKIVTRKEDGITITQSYENGVLSGPTTYSYPHTSTTQKKLVYDQGTLLKEIIYDQNEIPIRESDYEFEGQVIKTCWNTTGVPLSVEEFKGNLLIEGKYFDEDNNLEATVTDGTGIKLKKDRSNTLLHKETLEKGKTLSKICYYSDGTIQSETTYLNDQPHGLQKKFTESGKPLAFINWRQGTLDGLKVHYRNGNVIHEIPYKNGNKHGLEKQFAASGNQISEIPWIHGKKHGSARVFTEDNSNIAWFYDGKAVTRNQFESYEKRASLVADISEIFSSEEKMQ